MSHIDIAAGEGPAPRAARGKLRSLAMRSMLHLPLLACSVVLLLPLVWMVSTSLKATGSEFEYPPSWLPDPVVWRNYAEVFEGLPFHLFFRNTIIVVLGSLTGTTITASLVAYAFARLRYPGRDLWFMVLLSTMMLPSAVTLIPQYFIFRSLGWIDTLLPLFVPSWFGGGAFNVFLFRQFFSTIPYDLDEAAKVDGASTFRTYAQILLPLSGPAVTTVAVFSFIGHWNAFMEPLIYLNSTKNLTVAVGLQLFRTQYFGYWNLMMAAGVLTTLPCIALFFAAQRYFIRGIVMTGISGR
ncbi:MAG: carbohydrate ABC transporter permease [Anaerolineae bacterium]